MRTLGEQVFGALNGSKQLQQTVLLLKKFLHEFHALQIDLSISLGKFGVGGYHGNLMSKDIAPYLVFLDNHISMLYYKMQWRIPFQGSLVPVQRTSLALSGF